LKGQDVVELLAGDFELLHNLKMIFQEITSPVYEKYTNLDEAVRNLNDHKYLMGKYWKIMCQFAKLPLGRQGESSGTHPDQNMLKNQSARNCSKMDSLCRSRPHDPNAT
jgi:hypothetical protein